MARHATAADWDLDEIASMTGSTRGVAPPAPAPPKAPAPANGDLPKLRVGQELDGRVKKITDYGLIVTLADGESTDGFVHIKEIKDEFVHHPGEEAEEGDKVRVRVLKNEPDFLALTMRNIG